MIGDRAWIAKTSGNLSRSDRAWLMATIIQRRLMACLRPAAASEDLRGDLDVAMPDSRLVALAAAECREACSAAIYHHSCRTYFWAASLAKIGGVRHDPEELAIAALLHDLELGKVEERSQKGCHCFAGAGAVAANRWLTAHDVAPNRRAMIGEAIALHLNPGVPLKLGATPHLLNSGAAADVVGLRMKAIPRQQRENVLAAHPRSDFKREMKGHMQAEQMAHPKTRASYLMALGFARLIDSAPFDE